MSAGMNEVTVSEATAEDWELWRDLRLRALQDAPTAFGSTYEHERGFTEADWVERLDDPTGAAFLAKLEGVPVGMGGGYSDLPGWLHVVAMWTAPDARGRGVGRAVLQHLAAWARERELRLHLDVESGNVVARRLYERAGFVPTGETRPLREGSSYLVERMILGDQ